MPTRWHLDSGLPPRDALFRLRKLGPGITAISQNPHGLVRTQRRSACDPSAPHRRHWSQRRGGKADDPMLHNFTRRRLVVLVGFLSVFALIFVGRWLNATKVGGQQPA